MKKAPIDRPAPKKNRRGAKIAGAAVAVLLVGSCLANIGEDKGSEPAATAPAAATQTTAAVATTTAASPADTTSSTAQQATSTASAVEADTAASIVSRMDCQDKVLTRKQLDSDALTPQWVGTATTVAACTKSSFTQIVVAEYPTRDDALQAVARAQKSQGWRDRVTVDGRFARGAAGNDWSSVEFPKANQ